MKLRNEREAKGYVQIQTDRTGNLRVVNSLMLVAGDATYDHDVIWALYIGWPCNLSGMG